MTVRARERALSGLRQWDRNPRRISGERLEALKRSLEADRQMLEARPLIALLDGRVVCGNQRLLAAQELGWETIPTIVVDLDEERAAVWALRDNNSYGEWDDTLASLVAELAGDGLDLDLIGFAPADIERLLAEANAALTLADPNDAPPVPSTPNSRPGEVYALGPHRLVCGDATDADTLLTVANEVRAEVVWTDPPYGVDYEGKTAERLRIANDTPQGLERVLREAFAAADGMLVENARFYVCSPAASLGVVF